MKAIRAFKLKEVLTLAQYCTAARKIANCCFVWPVLVIFLEEFTVLFVEVSYSMQTLTYKSSSALTFSWRSKDLQLSSGQVAKCHGILKRKSKLRKASKHAIHSNRKAGSFLFIAHLITIVHNMWQERGKKWWEGRGRG